MRYFHRDDLFYQFKKDKVMRDFVYLDATKCNMSYFHRDEDFEDEELRVQSFHVSVTGGGMSISNSGESMTADKVADFIIQHWGDNFDAYELQFRKIRWAQVPEIKSSWRKRKELICWRRTMWK